MKIRILGSGEAFDQELGNNACLFSSKGLPTVLFDCGYQIPERLWREKEYSNLDGVYLTHLHADHCFGVVPLLTRFWEEKRRRPLTIIGPPGTRAMVTRLIQLGYPGLLTKFRFQLQFVELKPGDSLKWRKLEFETARSKHSVMNLAVRVTLPRGESFAISGDGNLTRATKELFRDVDLLLHEVYALKPGISAHCDLASLRKFVSTSNILFVGVTHVSRHLRLKMEEEILKLQKEDRKWQILSPGQTFILSAKPSNRLSY